MTIADGRAVDSGDEISILSERFAEDPYAFYRDLREHHPVYFDHGVGRYLVSRYEDVVRVSKDPSLQSISTERVHGRTILQMEGQEHSTKRNLISPSFRAAGVESFLPLIEANSAVLIDRFVHDGKGDLVDQFTTRLPINVIVDMLDLPKSDHDEFHEWYSSLIALIIDTTGDPEIEARGMRARAEMEAYMLPIIAARRANPGDDLLSRLAQAEIDGAALSDMEVKAFISLLFVAGGETTDKAMGLVVRNLLDNPDQFARVREDHSLIGAAFAETLRFSPPGHFLVRLASTDLEICGVHIPAGSMVSPIMASANRDPAKFADPDRFDIDRPDLDVARAYTAAANHTAFGAGRHFCVGALLAKSEVEHGLGMIVDRLKDLRYAPGFVPKEVGIHIRSLPSLEVEFTPA